MLHSAATLVLMIITFFGLHLYIAGFDEVKTNLTQLDPGPATVYIIIWYTFVPIVSTGLCLIPFLLVSCIVTDKFWDRSQYHRLNYYQIIFAGIVIGASSGTLISAIFQYMFFPEYSREISFVFIGGLAGIIGCTWYVLSLLRYVQRIKP